MQEPIIKDSFVNKPTGEILDENIVLWFKGRTFRKHGAPFELVKGIFRQEMHRKKFIITELIQVRFFAIFARFSTSKLMTNDFVNLDYFLLNNF